MTIVTFLLINVLVWASSLSLSHTIHRNERPSVLLLTACLVYFSQITLTVLFLGVVTGHLNARSLLLLNGTLSAVIILAAYQRLLLPYRAICAGLRSAGAEAGVVSVVMMVLSLAVISLLLARIWYLPPYVWDAMMYHLTPAVEWYQQERIPPALHHGLDGMNTQALGMTVLNFWFFVFLGNDLLVGLPQTIFAAMLALTAYAFVRETTGDRTLSLGFAVATLSIPFVLMQADTPKDHIALGASFFAGTFLLWKVLETGQSRYLLVAGLAFGLVSGFKIGAVVHFLIAVLVFVLYAVASRARGGFRMAGSKRNAILAWVGSVFLVVSLSGYWYSRETLRTVSPRVESQPAAESVSGVGLERPAPGSKPGSDTAQTALRTGVTGVAEGSTVIPSRIRFELSFAGPRLALSNLKDLLPRLFDYRANYSPDLTEISGYGPQFAAFGVPAFIFLVVQLLRRKVFGKSVYLIPVTAIALFVFYLPLYHNPNSYRLLSFLPFMLIPFAGFLLFEHGLYAGNVKKTLINGTVLVSSLWSISTTAVPAHDTSILALREFISLPREYRTSARFTGFSVSHTPSYRLFLENLPPEAPIAYLYDGPLFAEMDVVAVGQVWTYPYYDSSWARKLYYLALKNHLNCERFTCKPLPPLNDYLEKNRVSLLTTCGVNRCVAIRDQRYLELARGLYFYRGGDGRE